MAFVGGFLGGGVEMVPAGQGQLILQWQTPDRENQTATFKINGTGGSFTKVSNSSGYAEQLVPVGTYEVSVEHEGEYSGDLPITVIVESTQSYLVYFGATMGEISTIRINFSNPEWLNDNFTIKDSNGLTRYSGTFTTYEVEFPISDGTYTLSTDHFPSIEFQITEPGAKVITLEDYTGRITFNETGIPSGTIYKVDGVVVSIPYTTGIGSHTVSFETPEYMSGKKYAEIPDIEVNVVAGDNVLSPKVTPLRQLLTSSGTCHLVGKFFVLMFGGGGAGGAGSMSGTSATRGGGGAGGYYDSQIITASQDVQATIGAGGKGATDANGTAGGATSLGTLMSVSGGGAANRGNGGSGGSGGGGGANYSGVGGISTGQGYRGGTGGSGEYGGGGGGGPGNGGNSTYERSGSAGNGGASVHGGGGNGGSIPANNYESRVGAGGVSTNGVNGANGTIGTRIGGTGGTGEIPSIAKQYGFSGGAGGTGNQYAGGGGGAYGKGGNANYGGGGGGGYEAGGSGAGSDSYHGKAGGIGAGGAAANNTSYTGTKGTGGDGGKGVIVIQWVSR